jgi:predicted trehalose synthase
MEKVLYELRYEKNNRPNWLHIPLQGLTALLQGD